MQATVAEGRYYYQIVKFTRWWIKWIFTASCFGTSTYEKKIRNLTPCAHSSRWSQPKSFGTKTWYGRSLTIWSRSKLICSKSVENLSHNKDWLDITFFQSCSSIAPIASSAVLPSFYFFVRCLESWTASNVSFLATK